MKEGKAGHDRTHTPVGTGAQRCSVPREEKTGVARKKLDVSRQGTERLADAKKCCCWKRQSSCVGRTGGKLA